MRRLWNRLLITCPWCCSFTNGFRKMETVDDLRAVSEKHHRTWNGLQNNWEMRKYRLSVQTRTQLLHLAPRIFNNWWLLLKQCWYYYFFFLAIILSDNCLFCWTKHSEGTLYIFLSLLLKALPWFLSSVRCSISVNLG